MTDVFVFAEIAQKNVAVAATNDHTYKKMQSSLLVARSKTRLRGMLKKNASERMHENTVNSCKTELTLYKYVNIRNTK